MDRTEPFEKNFLRYEDWFEKNRYVYESELQAIRSQLPESNNGIEIGVGSGRFAVPLGIQVGIEPSGQMRKIARQRGIRAINSRGEKIPFGDEQFNFALMVTTICFLDDVKEAFKEVHRILKSGGVFIVGFVDKESLVGRLYQEHKDESLFYRVATFYSTREVVALLKETGFGNFSFSQTVFHKLDEVKSAEPVKEGYGEGSFVVVRAAR